MEDMVRNSFWRNKKVLITGNTGFKGSWLSYLLWKFGAKVYGISLNPNNTQDIYNHISKNFNTQILDITNYDKFSNAINTISPEIIFHLAAQSLVIESYKFPMKTFNTNIIGTANLLHIASRLKNLRALINITTDKCYQNQGWEWPYRESDALGGIDPYSSSKACSEIITTAMKNSFFLNSVGIATARAGNVIGGGDWSENRLIPDIIESIFKDKKLIIRNPNSIRPWQHVLDPLFGYIKLAECLYEKPEKYSTGWNFGPDQTSSFSVQDVINHFSILSNKKINLEIINNPSTFYESEILRLDISKVKSEIQWTPKWDFDKSVTMTYNWYKNFYNGKKVEDILNEQITEFISQ
jgi:CDP-glucose 4,6-dehydratase